MTDEFKFAKPQREPRKLSPAEQEQVLQSVINSHRLSGLEPTAEDIEVCRQILRGEITADEAVARALAHYQVPDLDGDDFP